jgi:hypothetical protein
MRGASAVRLKRHRTAGHAPYIRQRERKEDGVNEEILIPLGFFAMITAIVWFGSRAKQVRLTKQVETQKALLDKFQSGRELSEFMGTESGQRFLNQFDMNPHAAILGSVTAGIVLTCLGLGLLGLTGRDEDLVFPGVIMLALGVGFIVAAAISRRLSKKWNTEAVASKGSGRESAPA